ncbi:MAG: hypothetical protein JKY15_04995 [Deltaproteobacteria bacterium]|nr:hypothetical protein [Deltaproteobacteria bacterium]
MHVKYLLLVLGLSLSAFASDSDSDSEDGDNQGARQQAQQQNQQQQSSAASAGGGASGTGGEADEGSSDWEMWAPGVSAQQQQMFMALANALGGMPSSGGMVSAGGRQFAVVPGGHGSNWRQAMVQAGLQPPEVTEEQVRDLLTSVRNQLADAVMPELLIELGVTDGTGVSEEIAQEWIGMIRAGNMSDQEFIDWLLGHVPGCGNSDNNNTSSGE